MKTEKAFFFCEIPDTFSEDANYSWVRRYLVSAVSERGAVQKVARQYGAGWRYDGGRYNMRGACICMFVDRVENEELENIRARFVPYLEISN